MIITHHARKRWAERFSHLSIDREFLSSRRVGNKLRKKIKEKCFGNSAFCKRTFAGRYFLKSHNNVIFVMAPKTVVITVFCLDEYRK